MLPDSEVVLMPLPPLDDPPLMRGNTPHPGGLSEAEAAQRRRFGRLEQEYLACQYGPIMNLSAGGLCALCRGKGPVADERVDLEIFGLAEPFKIAARVAWKKRVGIFKHEVGFQFLDMTPEHTRKLTAAATSSRIKRVM